MSMNVQSTLSAYGNYQNGYRTVKEKQTEKNVKKTTKKNSISNGEINLSKAAKDMLKTLRASRSDMDFMVADFDKGDNAKEILAQSDKEFTVIFSSEELEKMAANEKYFAEKMRSIEGAIRMSEEINAQFGFERAAISLNSDGTITLFAELEKVTAKQKERLEELQEKKAEEKKEIKKVTVQAATQEELVDKIKAINWDTIKAETPIVGGKFDFSI